MTIEIKLPEIGDGIESGDVLDILVSEGDVIAKDADIIELETDKATLFVPSSHAGKVLKVHVAVGQTTPIGATLLTLEEVAADAPPAVETSPQESASHATASQQPIIEKPTPAVASNETPALPETPTPIPPENVAASQQPAVHQPASQASASVSDLIPAGPAVRRFAREVGVDLSGVSGSGENGRITRDDVLNVVRHANQKTTPPASEPAAGSPPEENPPADAEMPSVETPPAAVPPGETHLRIAAEENVIEQDEWGPVQIEKMSRVRKTIARKMHQSWTTVPRVTNFDNADITELERIRQGSKADYAAAGVKLTSMPFVIKAVAQALLTNPELNATVDLEGGEITYKQYVNIGLAVDTDRGLIVPVLRDADQLSVSEAARGLAALADRVRTNQFGLEDLQGGGFTISNLGAIGGVYSTPIINTPEVAILLVGRSRKMPVVVDDQIVVRLMMPLSLSYDHRLVDGGAAARFLNDVIALLESPSRLLLAP